MKSSVSSLLLVVIGLLLSSQARAQYVAVCIIMDFPKGSHGMVDARTITYTSRQTYTDLATCRLQGAIECQTTFLAKFILDQTVKHLLDPGLGAYDLENYHYLFYSECIGSDQAPRDPRTISSPSERPVDQPRWIPCHPDGESDNYIRPQLEPRTRVPHMPIPIPSLSQLQRINQVLQHLNTSAQRLHDSLSALKTFLDNVANELERQGTGIQISLFVAALALVVAALYQLPTGVGTGPALLQLSAALATIMVIAQAVGVSVPGLDGSLESPRASMDVNGSQQEIEYAIQYSIDNQVLSVGQLMAVEDNRPIIEVQTGYYSATERQTMTGAYWPAWTFSMDGVQPRWPHPANRQDFDFNPTGGPPAEPQWPEND